MSVLKLNPWCPSPYSIGDLIPVACRAVYIL